MSLRDLALEAYQEGAEEDAKAVAAREAGEKSKLEKLAREEFAHIYVGLPARVDGPELYIEDLEFCLLRQTYGHDYVLCLKGKCPECGGESYSYPVRCLEDLGRVLATFRPDPNRHECPQPAATPDPTWEQRFVALLDERYGRGGEQW